jgi:hypothetical protein
LPFSQIWSPSSIGPLHCRQTCAKIHSIFNQKGSALP